jgi:hypothetical protein
LGGSLSGDFSILPVLAHFLLGGFVLGMVLGHVGHEIGGLLPKLLHLIPITLGLGVLR